MNDELRNVKNALEQCLKLNNRCKTCQKIGGKIHDFGRKQVSHYQNLKQGDEFWN